MFHITWVGAIKKLFYHVIHQTSLFSGHGSICRCCSWIFLVNSAGRFCLCVCLDVHLNGKCLHVDRTVNIASSSGVLLSDDVVVK